MSGRLPTSLWIGLLCLWSTPVSADNGALQFLILGLIIKGWPIILALVGVIFLMLIGSKSNKN